MSDFYIPPEGWENPIKASNGTIRRFLVRWETRDGGAGEGEVDAENFHDARVRAMGGYTNYHKVSRSTIFERVAALSAAKE